MASSRSDPRLLSFYGRQKYFVKGQKRYAAVIHFRRKFRILRMSARTASMAVEYGEAVVKRYQHWLDLATAKEKTAKRKKKTAKQPTRHTK
jgi:hypothetical protein